MKKTKIKLSDRYFKAQRWLRVLFRRRFFIALLLILQVLFLLYIIISGTRYSVLITWILTGISLYIALLIASKQDTPAYKLIWVFQILTFPIFGGLFYLLFNFQSSTKKFSRKLEVIAADTEQLFFRPGNDFDYACALAPECVPQIQYLQKFAGFPIYRNNRTLYLSPGERKFKALVDELEKAEKYIFMEYFIIQEGVMWSTILTILAEKARQGVEVRVMYDDVGCFFLLPKDYPKILESMGIKCMIFNPFRPVLTAKQNNRDHRKIAVIDGITAFTGGINLADEYINVIDKHGHWKDASIMIQGPAAWSLTLIFLQMWGLCSNKPDYVENYSKYLPSIDNVYREGGLVQPYADSPMDRENVGEHVYMQIINNAKKYVYINTPYLIIDDTMLSAISLASKSGIDVRIITPHQGDKWWVHMTTRSYYKELMQSGVKIYEYTKGFNHAKTFVSDDKVATVGTTNLDFRSLYLHFECGVWIYKSAAVNDIRDDFLETLNECQIITPANCKYNAFTKLLQDILRLYAPLM